jgi:hypothetical protein
MSNLDRGFLAGDHRYDVKVTLFNAVTEEDVRKAVKLKGNFALQRKPLK